MEQQNTLKPVSILSVAILVAQITLSVFNLYEKYPRVDIPMHVLGGAWVASIFFYVFYEKFLFLDKKKGFWPNLIIVLGFVALIGTLWEFYEFFFDTFITTLRLQTLPDTLKDLIDDILGGALYSLFYLLKK